MTSTAQPTTISAFEKGGFLLLYDALFFLVVSTIYRDPDICLKPAISALSGLLVVQIWIGYVKRNRLFIAI